MSELDAFYYEAFIRRGLKCERDFKKGADKAFMKNLIDTEQRASWTKILGSYDKQLDKIKKYMNKAFTGYYKRKLTEEESNALVRLHERLDQAYHAQELVSICKEALEVTARLKES